MPVQLTTKQEATKLLAGAKTLGVVRLLSAADLNELAKTLKEHLPARLIVVK
jgi:hypothetical protein